MLVRTLCTAANTVTNRRANEKNHFIIITLPLGFSKDYSIGPQISQLMMDIFVVEELILMYEVSKTRQSGLKKVMSVGVHPKAGSACLQRLIQ